MMPPRIPLATYRLQFNREFTFAHATALVPYLAALGISHCYASPYLKARPGSTHGYDIIDHNHLNPEIGSQEDFNAFVKALRDHGMGQILDIVPNHMGVMGSDNLWWMDVLENGEASNYADFFDIDWQPLKDELEDKILVPVLGDQYGTVLDRGELQLKFDRKKGEFSIFYHQHRFPVNPKEYPRIFRRGVDRLDSKFGSQHEALLELQSLISAFNHLPARNESAPDKKTERARDKEIHKRRLASLCLASPEIAGFIDENVRQINGSPENPDSFNDLHELIKAQVYRLASWRVAADDINYRRFFDVNELAGLRMEKESVFEATHSLVLELIHQGKLDGLRIDHPDGLYDPAAYFKRLQRGLQGEAPSPEGAPSPFYVVIEKVLIGDEQLPDQWPVHGTTGYEFTNLVNGLFVDSSAAGKFNRIYRSFLEPPISFDKQLYVSKKLVMNTALASELNVLANALHRLALSNRHTCDYTLNSLREAITRIVACFPVYRTYITAEGMSKNDSDYIESAIACAKRRSPGSEASVFDFVRDILLTQAAERKKASIRDAALRFAMKFQQFTSAVMAKGLEDTSFYRYHRLISLNEVGGDPKKFGVLPEAFHLKTQERATKWPHSMLATSTHDTKNSEDVRARINVLSEIPALWRRRVRRWEELNHSKKALVAGSEAPSRNDEYRFYQMLVGAWPAQEAAVGEGFCDRITGAMRKAVREAKEKTSWANPSADYEDAMAAFIRAVLQSGEQNEFLSDFIPFQNYIASIGVFNSLAQTLLKLTSPGVPDIYQGNELLDFSLVDPDNRRPVDYKQRLGLLDEMLTWDDATTLAARVHELVENIHDGRIKMYLTWKALGLRKKIPSLFQAGEYLPLAVAGPKADHMFAFARRFAQSVAVVCVSRLNARLLAENSSTPSDPNVWADTRLILPWLPNEGRCLNHFTGEGIQAISSGEGSSIPAGALFAGFPVTLLTAELPL